MRTGANYGNTPTRPSRTAPNAVIIDKVVLLGEQRASKTRGVSSTPTDLPFCPRGPAGSGRQSVELESGRSNLPGDARNGPCPERRGTATANPTPVNDMAVETMTPT